MSSALKQEYLPRYTYEDYCQWEGRWEIIEGIPYAMSPSPSGKHQWILGNILTLLSKQLQNYRSVSVSMPMDWRVNDLTVIQPDAFVADYDVRSLDYLTDAPVIVVEILSTSTREKDTFLKKDIYLSQGVKYYIIVDPKNDTYQVLQLSGTEFRVAQQGHDGTFTFEIQDNCRATIDFGKIWE